MCGINGIVQLRYPDDRPGTTLDEIQAMNDAIRHRGPDGEGTYVTPEIALGHRRLAILDLSKNGAQPMFSEDKSLALVFNGEIYNYIELRDELAVLGCNFRTHTDTEVILHAYAKWGEDCVRRFNGMWAFALWDVTNKKLFASRDRLGVKPFVYYSDLERLVFSSEIVGILAVQKITEANPGKVHDYLAYGYRINDGETFFKDIKELPPAHSLTVENGRLSINRYWELPKRQSDGISYDDLRKTLISLIEDAVRLRFRSDVPVALMQSGGLDSSIIASVVNDSIESGKMDATSVIAYTAHFPSFVFDETDTVRQLIDNYPHIQLHPVEVNSNDLCTHLETFVSQMGEPVASPTSFAHWMLMRKLAGAGVKVVINGQGSDEAFAGYGKYAIGFRLLDIALSSPFTLPTQLIDAKKIVVGNLQMVGLQFFKAIFGRRAASLYRARIIEKTLAVLNNQFHAAESIRLPDLSMTFTPHNLDRHLRSQLMHFGFNQILHYEDQSAMSNSIEIRSPFIDYRIMEFAFRLPDRFKLDHGITKKILRDCFAARLPASIVHNTRKIGFATPTEEWFDEPTTHAAISEILQSKEFQSRKIWNAMEICARFHTSPSESFPLWRFINVELWIRAFGINNLGSCKRTYAPVRTRRIAVLIACHNRRAQTVKCLQKLREQVLPGWNPDGVKVDEPNSECQSPPRANALQRQQGTQNEEQTTKNQEQGTSNQQPRTSPALYAIEVFLLDDGCTDGTADGVREVWPGATIIQGDGNHYWCGGMRAAWTEAAKTDPDYYLFLNDDTFISNSALHVMLKIVGQPSDLKIAVGAIIDPKTDIVTYGGHVGHNNTPVPISGHPTPCDTLNANCALVSRAVYGRIGMFYRSYIHGLGDYDYGFMARRNGIGVIQTPHPVGECSPNSNKNTWLDTSLSRRERFKLLWFSHTGLPIKQWMIYTIRNTNLLWPYKCISPALRILAGK